ncbi:hypothetical protein [Dyella telluris]|uniref:Uncharacterized protein n=1 Tax=Dyella telluris TaxID=2763498 RepID=A0A7G8Q8Y4_9GAMM|nr:hypothetical protein [Dyella telluris]QNK03242.1 hypothetical protein H8F01_09110 [Dyella telluris]
MGQTAFSQNQFPELKGLTNSQDDKAKAYSLCAKYGGSTQERICRSAAAYYMNEGQQQADMQKQQVASASQATGRARQSQQGGVALGSAVATPGSASISPTNASAQSAVEPISDDDMADMLTKALVAYATQHKDAYVCAANTEALMQVCQTRLKAFDSQHFQSQCHLNVQHDLEIFREWGDVLKGDEARMDAGIAVVRSKADTKGCKPEEIAYFDQITSAALERAQNVIPKVRSQAAAQGDALTACRASAAYKRFDAAASIPNLRANLSTQESYLHEYQKASPATVKDANKLQRSIANENAAITLIQETLAQKTSDYKSFGGNVNDQAQMSKDAASNPCAALGDNWLDITQ